MKNKKKILIVSVSSGAGHIRAAQAIEKTAEQSFSEFEVKHIDFLQYISKGTKKIFFDWYKFVVLHRPQLYGFCYKKSDRPNIKKGVQKITKLLTGKNAKSFLKEVEKFYPDFILCTYFVPADILSQTKFKHIPRGTVITDYGFHEFWFTDEKQMYFVASKEIGEKLKKRNVPKTHIVQSGIPINPDFYKEKSETKLREAFGIKQKQKVILILSGGQGLIKSNKIAQQLFSLDMQTTIIAIAGKNKILKKNLDDLMPPPHIQLISVGWTNKMDNYMRVADLIITKPGGLTVSECTALKKPMLLVSPIPGQEECNAIFVKKNKLGLIARDIKEIAKQTSLLLNNQIPIKKLHFKKPAANIILERIKKH